MNREIKFRVWDKYTKSFFIKIDFADANKGDSVGNYMIAFPIYPHREYIFQQFTGLKDKNDKEIYEGDIVNTNGKNYEIIWRGAGFYCVGSDYPLGSCWFVGGNPYIIGNIFENPEILNKNK